MTVKDWKMFNTSTCCHICNEIFEDELKVKDHDHFTGKFRGAAPSEYNLKFKESKLIPVFFHNLTNYDSHLFINQLGVTEGKIDSIAIDLKVEYFVKKLKTEKEIKELFQERDINLSLKEFWDLLSEKVKQDLSLEKERNIKFIY